MNFYRIFSVVAVSCLVFFSLTENVENNLEDDCVICHDKLNIAENNNVFELTCLYPHTHTFHTNCIRDWLRIKTECPNCRHPVTPNDLNALGIVVPPIDPLALIKAACNGNTSAVVALMARPDIDINLVDNFGMTALIYAARGGHNLCVAALVTRLDININYVNSYGMTALIYAASEGGDLCVAALITHPNIDLNFVNINHMTALIYAARHGHDLCVAALLTRANIFVNFVNIYNMTALKYAQENGHNAIVNLITDFMNN